MKSKVMSSQSQVEFMPVNNEHEIERPEMTFPIGVGNQLQGGNLEDQASTLDMHVDTIQDESVPNHLKHPKY